MATISLCMIVKNEEQVLNRCLISAKNLFDEIIIVDTGSKDKTKQIAQKFTNKVYDFVWGNDFSKARNYAIKKATSDYIMWLDADDVIPKRTLNYLQKNKSNLKADVYMLKYDIAFSGNKATFSFYRERIIKNCNNCCFYGCVHECITPFGKVERLNYSIEHKKISTNKPSSRNLKIYQNTLKTRSLSPRELYYFARELFDHKKYKQCITYLNKFLKTQKGWIENIIDAYFLKAKCYLFLNNSQKHLECLFKTFELDQPRANVCCLIGDYFLTNKNYQIAIYWYTQATKCKDVINKGGFVQPFYYNYYPFLQMCVCYYNLNDIKKAKIYNQKAGKIFDSPTVHQNRKFFDNLL